MAARRAASRRKVDLGQVDLREGALRHDRRFRSKLDGQPRNVRGTLSLCFGSNPVFSGWGPLSGRESICQRLEGTATGGSSRIWRRFSLNIDVGCAVVAATGAVAAPPGKAPVSVQAPRPMVPASNTLSV